MSNSRESPMPLTQSLAATLPAAQPDEPGPRLLLFGIRQMGGHGLHDASAANAFVTGMGHGFRRPLVLLRALIAEISAEALGPIQIAPWCCPRMTAAEATLLRAVGCARARPALAELLLADLMGVRAAGSITATAAAVAHAFDDLALPLN